MEKLKTPGDADLSQKNVILRVDFNCPMENGELLDTFRIDRTIPTVKYLIEKGARKIVIISHLGRPDGKYFKDLSLRNVVRYFSDAIKKDGSLGLDVVLLPYEEDIKKSIAAANEKTRDIVFLENIRFWKEEEEGDDAFAAELAGLGEVYINDAFSACHRAHASISGIPKKLPSFAGLLLAEEVRRISEAIENPEKPAVAVVGGAKLETKMPVLKELVKRYDKVLVGGLIAVELQADPQALAELPTNIIVLPTGYADNQKRDIDKQTAEIFADIIKGAKTVLWNGPMGKFEERPFDYGGRVIAEAVAQTNGVTVVGGGETIEVLNRCGLFDKMDFVSTGGGAMLEFIAGEKLPGIEAIKI